MIGGLHTTLEGVDNYAVYSISVLAFTVKGDGAASEAIYAGKSICCQRTWMKELQTYKKKGDITSKGPILTGNPRTISKIKAVERDPKLDGQKDR